MGITTTESVGQYKGAAKCYRCGWPGAILTRDHAARLVHWDDCPDGPPPSDEEVLIAHDPLSGTEYDSMGRALPPHSSLDALERLRRLGVGLTKTKGHVAYPRVDEVLGDIGPEVLELKTEVLRKQLANEEMKLVGGGPTQVPSFEPEVRYGSRRKSKKES